MAQDPTNPPPGLRILLVSTLFPTTILTGGTLVPHKQALALRDMGHAVTLFGGQLRYVPSDWATLEGPDGIPARFVDVTGKLDPQAPEYFTNPRAEREFRVLLEQGFDVVHFHSLQGLGTSLVPLARETGAGTIVQMHDFFWVCDRQFLLTRDCRPCLGPGGPGCSCHADMGARPPRMTDLESADLLLVPTPQMRLWLANLGLEPSRMRVAGWPEAGLPDPSPATSWDITTPYLLYLGGASGEKGWPTLLLAAWGDESNSLRILCPGIAASAIPAELAGTLLGGPRAPREEISLLIQHANGVVVPSLAAETYSYVAREAMGLGVPVVITDGPGGVDCWQTRPDLVRLVPRGRADHLATAMLELLGSQSHGDPHAPADRRLPAELSAIYNELGEQGRARRGLNQ
jgi:glycosyltransferase involved in cell wall biosynthesis